MRGLLKIVKLTCFTIISVIIFLGAKSSFDKIAYKEPEIIRVPVYVERPPIENTIVEKTHFREAFVEEISSKQELITLEVELSEEIELDDSWSTFDWLKKNQKVIFTGIGLYTTDLSKINENSILVDDFRKIIQVKLEAPTPKIISIDESKTVYEAIENGVLRTSKEIKLTTSEQQVLLVQVKSAMEEKLIEKELMNKAKDSARISVINLYKNILNQLDAVDYSIDIVFN